jgi:hypothetical protein
MSEIKERRNLLSDENFDRLRKAQTQIQKITEFSPSLRMIINDLITEDAINESSRRIIEKISVINH